MLGQLRISESLKALDITLCTRLFLLVHALRQRVPKVPAILGLMSYLT